MKNKQKGFTIVELVIVIAVIAVLAAVAIPTFSSIVKRANISADSQAVRNMNVILTSESLSSPAPAISETVRKLLRGNGFTDLTPQTRFYTFYWLEDENVILLADEGDRPVYPEEYIDVQYNSNWHALDGREFIDLPSRPEGEDVRDPRTFSVTFTQSGTPVQIPFENVPTTATEGRGFVAEITLPEAFRTDPYRYRMSKITVIMSNGATEHVFELRSEENLIAPDRFDIPFKVDEVARVEIPYVTGNIEINVDVLEFSIVTLKCDLPDGTEFVHKYSFRKTSHYSIICDSLSESILRGYAVVSAKGFRGEEELGELYNKRFRQIEIPKELLFSDLEIIIEVEPKPNE